MARRCIITGQQGQQAWDACCKAPPPPPPASVATSLFSCTRASSQICTWHQVHHGQPTQRWTTAPRTLAPSSDQPMPRSVHEQRCVMTRRCIPTG